MSYQKFDPSTSDIKEFSQSRRVRQLRESVANRESLKQLHEVGHHCNRLDKQARYQLVQARA